MVLVGICIDRKRRMKESICSCGAFDTITTDYLMAIWWKERVSIHIDPLNIRILLRLMHDTNVRKFQSRICKDSFSSQYSSDTETDTDTDVDAGANTDMDIDSDVNS
jgi:hypothetical protein